MAMLASTTNLHSHCFSVKEQKQIFWQLFAARNFLFLTDKFFCCLPKLALIEVALGDNGLV